MPRYKIQHAKVEDLILPGVTLRDIIEFNKFDLEEIKAKTGVSPDDIKALMEGKKAFTEDISNKLSEFIKLPENFWYNLQKLYNDEKAKILRREKARASKLASVAEKAKVAPAALENGNGKVDDKAKAKTADKAKVKPADDKAKAKMADDKTKAKTVDKAKVKSAK